MNTRLFNWLKHMAVLVLLIVALLPTQGASALGTRRYARPGGLISGECKSWATACDLSYILAFWAAPGDEVWAQAGVYVPVTFPDRAASFIVADDVKVYGGFAGGETLLSQRNPGANLTILSGNIGPLASYHVVVAAGGPETLLDGFTITGGCACGSQPFEFIGGGILNLNGGPTLRNLIITGNIALGNGGGMYTGPSASPTLENVVFSNNWADGGGGGMYNYESAPVLKNVTFQTNTSASGGGMYNLGSHVVMTNVSFNGNWVEGHGGGLFNSGSLTEMSMVNFKSNHSSNYGGGMTNTGASDTTIVGARFIGNTAANGGGMFNDSELLLTHVTFDSNVATDFAGGLYNEGSVSSVLRNVTFSRNSAGTAAGALYNEASKPVIQNSTFAGNSATVAGAILNYSSEVILMNVTVSRNTSSFFASGMHSDGGGIAAVNNSIFWGNVGGEISNVGGATVTIDHSILKGGCPTGDPTFTCSMTGTGNPKLGPLAKNGGFTKTLALQAGSSAIDKGWNFNCTRKDQRGVKRPQGVRCDIGAFEYVP